ncbi:FAD-binding oxidoreductase [Arenibacterium sp. LLYu02]|uniref:FAD-binding oxidoreductase n=1 Tax=Arenibacterium sp. LLYu02 TaxID=3404132 RepID=UPI003B20C5DF
MGRAHAHRTCRSPALAVGRGGVTSFRLASANGGSLPPFVPGQHLPVTLAVPGHPHPIERNYSLSGPPGDPTYRITVKREAKGIASRFLHDRLTVGDEIEARAPSGDFRLPGGETPLVLASAGVGATPMLPMLLAAAASRTSRRVWFFHGVRNAAEHVLRREADALARQVGTLSLHCFYSAPRPADLPLPPQVRQGRMTAADLVASGAGPEADYLLCGPPAFTAELASGLADHGIPPARIHTEDFGPAA